MQCFIKTETVTLSPVIDIIKPCKLNPLLMFLFISCYSITVYAFICLFHTVVPLYMFSLIICLLCTYF